MPTTTYYILGLLLLCDVALGNMYERTKADYIGNQNIY